MISTPIRAQALAVILCACSPAARDTNPEAVPLTEGEANAVKAAERYVIEQCHTSRPCDEKNADLNMPGAPTALLEQKRAQLLAIRRRFGLKASAYGVFPGVNRDTSGAIIRNGSRPGWSVFFEPANQDPKDPHLVQLYLDTQFHVLAFEHLDVKMTAPMKILTHRQASAGAQ